MIRRAAVLLLVGGGLALFLQREETHGTFDPWHRVIFDWLNGRGSVAPVVMVEMRRGDLPFESWPPAPLDYALIFESLVRRQPRAVAVDSPLAWPAVAGLDAATLAERIALLPRGVLACSLQRGVVGATADAPAVVPLVVLPNIRGDLSRLPDFSAMGQMPVEEVRGSKGLGFTRIEFGAEPVAGESSVTIPLLARRGKEVVPSLLLQSLMAWEGRGAADISIELGRRIVIADNLILPIDESGGFTVRSHLSPVLRRAAAGSLLLDMEQDGKLLRSQPAETEALAAMQGALVVVGETGEGTFRFPVGPGREWTETELLAQGLAAALTEDHVQEVPRRWQWGLWAVVATAAMVLPGCSRRWILGFGLLGVVVLALSTSTVFLLVRWWMPPLPMLALWTASGVVALLLATPSRGEKPMPGNLPGPETSGEPEPAAPAQPAAEDEALARTLLDEPPPLPLPASPPTAPETEESGTTAETVTSPPAAPSPAPRRTVPALVRAASARLRGRRNPQRKPK